MSESTTTPPAAAPDVNTAANDQIAQFANQLAGAIAGVQPKRKVEYHELEPVTAFNPRGKRVRKLARKTFVNGLPQHANTHTLHDEEIALLNKITPGRYLNGLVTVTERDLGPNGSAIYLWWPNRTHDQRMAIKGEARNLRELLKRCLDEAKSGAAKQ